MFYMNFFLSWCENMESVSVMDTQTHVNVKRRILKKLTKRFLELVVCISTTAYNQQKWAKLAQ